MTYTNAGTVKQAVQAFRKLDTNNKLMALMALFQNLQDSGLQSMGFDGQSKSASDLVNHVQEMGQENQVEFLQDALDNRQTGDEQIELDPHPTKAMLELLPGGIKPPLSQYGELGESDRLAFWYQLGKQLQTRMPGLTAASGEVGDFLKIVGQGSPEEQVEFLQQVI